MKRRGFLGMIGGLVFAPKGVIPAPSLVVTPPSPPLVPVPVVEHQTYSTMTTYCTSSMGSAYVIHDGIHFDRSRIPKQWKYGK